MERKIASVAVVVGEEDNAESLSFCLNLTLCNLFNLFQHEHYVQCSCSKLMIPPNTFEAYCCDLNRNIAYFMSVLE